jgi:hypothetical protein
MNKEDMSVYDEPQCEEVFSDEDDKHGTTRPYGGCEGHWPGDGSGMDDFADYNQNEGGDW